MSNEPVAKLLTIQQAMDTLGVSYSKLKSLIRAGELKFVKIGRRVQIPADEITKLIAARLQTWQAKPAVVNEGAADADTR